jgi:hypothetical protein
VLGFLQCGLFEEEEEPEGGFSLGLLSGSEVRVALRMRFTRPSVVIPPVKSYDRVAQLEKR